MSQNFRNMCALETREHFNRFEIANQGQKAKRDMCYSIESPLPWLQQLLEHRF